MKTVNTNQHVTQATNPGDATAERKQRVISDASKAAFIFNKLNQLDAEEQEELTQSPDNIRKRFKVRRDVLLEGVPQSVVDLVSKMRA